MDNKYIGYFLPITDDEYIPMDTVLRHSQHNWNFADSTTIGKHTIISQTVQLSIIKISNGSSTKLYVRLSKDLPAEFAPLITIICSIPGATASQNYVPTTDNENPIVNNVVARAQYNILVNGEKVASISSYDMYSKKTETLYSETITFEQEV